MFLLFSVFVFLSVKSIEIVPATSAKMLFKEVNYQAIGISIFYPYIWYLLFIFRTDHYAKYKRSLYLVLLYVKVNIIP